MSKSVDYNKKILEVSHLKEYFKVGIGKNRLIVKAVDDVTFDIYKKEVFGLVGESGCGKTTTGRTILRLYRPTSGTVKLEGDIVGSGSEDIKQEIRNARVEYKLNVLKLNQYQYDKYLVEQKTKEKQDVLTRKIAELNQQFKKEENAIKLPISEYKSKIFDAKNNMKVEIEKISFAYHVHKDAEHNKTKNEHLIEMNHLLKGLELSYEKKLEGIKESAALSNEVKAEHRKRLLEERKLNLAKIKEEYQPKIDAASKNLLTKQECKLNIKKIKENFLKEKEEIINSHKKYVAQLVKPDYTDINSKLAVLKAKLDSDVQKIKTEIELIKSSGREEAEQIHSSKETNREELQHIRQEYKEFITTKRQEIRNSKRTHFSDDALKKTQKMQMIFQDPISSLNPRMTVQEIVSEGLVIHGETDKELIRKKVIQALELVGLAPEYISRYPHEFSGGQRQRIGIARALIMNPSVIVADEPISALDVSIKAQVINLLSDLREQLDLTILFIAHDLSVVKFFCDRIAVMYFGKIVELASSEELFKHPLHAYTKSLLSAIPHPDPDSEKKRKRMAYNPRSHDYSVDKPTFVEITSGHFVRANQKEILEMKKELGVADEN